jgi:hypothetical protein
VALFQRTLEAARFRFYEVGEFKNHLRLFRMTEGVFEKLIEKRLAMHGADDVRAETKSKPPYSP